MAITPLTGFKAFTFDGEKSTDYGVQILGEGVFNAPEREVEMINIPGRNGAFALDKGRFENIEVTYPANIIADSTADFAAAVSDLRNMLCSRRGYVRLQDDYHPDEYRMAVYKKGLEVDEKVLRAGEFDITFDCKPQRFLTSGEEPIAVTSGQAITNPTLFESSPMLEVEGYGNIVINGETVTIQDEVIGTIPLTQKKTEQNTFSNTITCSVKLPTGSYQAGDKIYDPKTHGGTYQSDGQMRGKTGYAADYSFNSIWEDAGFYFEAGTPYHRVDTYSDSALTVFVRGTSTAVGTFTPTRTITFDYDGVDTFTVMITVTFTGTGAPYVEIANQKLQVFALYVDSTKPAVEGTIYIDLDIGEAWVENGGEVSPANNVVAIPAEMPKLKSGVNTITYDNTIDYTKITPMWWKI